MGLTPEQVRQVQFDPPAAGRKGYDEGEVDTFLDLVEATLRGRGGLTPADIRAVEFSRPAFLRRGYDPDQVDAFLDEVRRELLHRAAAVRGRRFSCGGDLRAVRLPRATAAERSYAASDVDALMERVATALDGGRELSAVHLAAATLSPGSAVPGYRADTVDELLAELVQELRHRDG